MERDIRWKQRFENYQRAIKLLQEVTELDLTQLSMLEKEGIIQRNSSNLCSYTVLT
jgi:hypothetical protein